ncbi:MAG: hypothetical protein GXO64_04570 [Candidatus Micrarchaeota archaeon]|nr:hypothetical protein [Candidatus Micrarchaeota archaeon]
MRNALLLYPSILAAVLFLSVVVMLPVGSKTSGMLTAQEQGNVIALFWFGVLVFMTVVYIAVTKSHENRAKKARRRPPVIRAEG